MNSIITNKMAVQTTRNSTRAVFSLLLSKGQGESRRPSLQMLLPTTATTRGLASTNYSSDSDSKRRRSSMENAKDTLARAALKQVPRYGWTQDAISVAATEDPKLSLSMSGMLSPSELVGWFMDDMNQQLRTKKEEKTNNKDNDNNNNDGMQFEAIRWRLEQVLPLVESGQWHRGMAMGLSNPLVTRSQLHEFIELIAPENSSTAYHTALGAIFVATELHLLTDDSSSSNYADTWSFLKSRLNDLERHQRECGGDVDPGQFLLQLASSSSSSLPSLYSLGNMTNSIPVVAGMAVAQSLIEGAASLVLPQSFRVLPPNNNNNNEQQSSMAGTKPSDYESRPPRN